MTRRFRLPALKKFAPALTLALLCAMIGASPVATGQAPAGTVEPMVRVAANSTPDKAAAEVAARIIPPATPGVPFDLQQRPGEHPLMPALRIAQDGVKHIDANIKDYSAILYKQERIEGELHDEEVAFVKVRHQPFSVHMFFLSPNKGRECLYVEGPAGTDGKLHARDCGFRRRLGVFKLEPDGKLAMDGQKYPITKIGIRNLTTELISVASNDINYGECEVRTAQTAIGPANGAKRPVTMIEVTHPVPRKNFRFHMARVFIDNELRVPIRYASYMWPSAAGEQPPLEEAYTYVNLKINNGFTDADFDPKNPEIFKN